MNVDDCGEGVRKRSGQKPTCLPLLNVTFIMDNFYCTGILQTVQLCLLYTKFDLEKLLVGDKKQAEVQLSHSHLCWRPYSKQIPRKNIY